MLIFLHILLFIFMNDRYIVLLSCLPTVIFEQINFTNLIYFWEKTSVKIYIFVNLKL